MSRLSYNKRFAAARHPMPERIERANETGGGLSLHLRFSAVVNYGEFGTTTTVPPVEPALPLAPVLP